MIDLREEFREHRAYAIRKYLESEARVLLEYLQDKYPKHCPENWLLIQGPILHSLVYFAEKLCKFDFEETKLSYTKSLFDSINFEEEQKDIETIREALYQDYIQFRGMLEEDEVEEVTPENCAIFLAKVVSNILQEAALPEDVLPLCREHMSNFFKYLRELHQSFLGSLLPKAGIAIELTSGIDVEVQVHGTILLKCVNQTIDKLRATLSSHPEIKVAKDRIESFRREMLYKNLSLSRGLLHFRHVDEDSQVFLDKRRSFWKDFASFVSNTQYDGSEETQNMIFKESCAVDPELVEDLLDKDPDYDKDLMQVDHESLFEATIHIREKLGARLFDPIKTEFAQSLMAIILVLAGNDDQQIDASHRPLN